MDLLSSFNYGCSMNNDQRIDSIKVIPINEKETPFSFLPRKNIDNQEENDYLNCNMKIFLRFRPASDNFISPYAPESISKISAVPPEGSYTYKNIIHGGGQSYQTFTFSKIFPEYITQNNLFIGLAKPLLEDFVNGYDRLLFTFGTTSSGKTHTMIGTKQDIGIIPQSLISLFKNCEISRNILLKPSDHSSVIEIKEFERNRIMKDRQELLKLSSKENCNILNEFESFKSIDLNISSVHKYSMTFWVSFVEIYNEVVYDLLDIKSFDNKLKRTMLDIRTARNGCAFVKGLKCFPVNSAEEAYRMLLVGRRNQKFATTKLNKNSSRSHTIFMIRAVRMMDKSEYLTKVVNFSFCDLAGSERTIKAETQGQHRKEACNINNSLMTLGRCLNIIRSNQENPTNQQVVPFRESKLTRLFQSYLTGNGKAFMVVCINQNPSLFDETLQVLRLSAIAKKIVLISPPTPLLEPSSSNSMIRRLRISSIGKGDDDNVDVFGEPSIGEEEAQLIEKLREELIWVKRNNLTEIERAREEERNIWHQFVQDLENQHKNQIDIYEKQREIIEDDEDDDEEEIDIIAPKSSKKRKFSSIKYMTKEVSQKYDELAQFEIDNLTKEVEKLTEDLAFSKETTEDLLKEVDWLKARNKELEYEVQQIKVEKRNGEKQIQQLLTQENKRDSLNKSVQTKPEITWDTFNEPIKAIAHINTSYGSISFNNQMTSPNISALSQNLKMSTPLKKQDKLTTDLSSKDLSADKVAVQDESLENQVSILSLSDEEYDILGNISSCSNKQNSFNKTSTRFSSFTRNPKYSKTSTVQSCSSNTSLNYSSSRSNPKVAKKPNQLFHIIENDGDDEDSGDVNNDGNESVESFLKIEEQCRKHTIRLDNEDGKENKDSLLDKIEPEKKIIVNRSDNDISLTPGKPKILYRLHTPDK